MSNLTKRQKERALVILAVVLLLAVAAYSYFKMYAPAHSAREQAELIVSSEREVVIALEDQLMNLPIAEPVSARMLQQEVPVQPLADRLLLQIEEAEFMSGTFVNSVEFAQGPFTMPAPVEGVEQIEVVTTNVSFRAEDYENITDFITEIEKMDRIMVVDAIEFSSYEEMTVAETENEPMEVSISFSAFYRPDLIALENTAPRVDAPVPAAKVNPLPINGDTNSEDE
ncbi:hypothetical protein [Planococcus lenghuensis]|uniref:Pilus assembly protein PilO n=1 Tax=Planococcus lenghuensis TaxID=2213202 RepID=A0A1Q2KXR0_9BACL|nr:hypothetical protein [Planococcus lenghuensis]AQQ52894.1 hypothetical protein B0X71_07190 [Planococcus lenghuensis]